LSGKRLHHCAHWKRRKLRVGIMKRELSAVARVLDVVAALSSYKATAVPVVARRVSLQSLFSL
jgi:hypothetical protein